jgi:hypothetical protein
MASPYGRTISVRLIQSSKHRGNLQFLSTVNLALRLCIKINRDAAASMSAINEVDIGDPREKNKAARSSLYGSLSDEA